MKIETPQILWHGDNDSGKNAPLYSLSLLESGLMSELDTTGSSYGHVLVTCGNSSEIHLWKVSFGANKKKEGEKQRIFQLNNAGTSIQHMLTLSRHERSVNTVAFSPDGLHLATAGDGGSIIVWSVPPSKRGNQNGRHFWSTLTKEPDLTVRILSSSCEGISDISWSADSKRFVAGSIDHAVLIYEDENYDANQAAVQSGRPQVDPQWRTVYRNARDHTHFVQGVSYDPLGVYVSSMGSDRTVRVYARKTPPKSKKKVLRQKNSSTGPVPPPEHQQLVERILSETKLELSKAKTLKYRHAPSSDESAPPKKQYLFADESTVETFFRRLSWTTDGAFLVTPAALWHKEADQDACFATYLFARHRFDSPYKVLPGLDKPSVVVRSNPVLFQLPESAVAESKENKSGAALPYRSVFAVLTLDSVLVYDTHHDQPLCIARGLHYAGLTDCTWSSDGRNLLVTSTDGYLSILSFAEGELGKVYTPPRPALLAQENTANHNAEGATTEQAPASMLQNEENADTSALQPKQNVASNPRIPPCEPGEAATLEARPAKKAKTRITPTLISPAALQKKHAEESAAAAVAERVKNQLTLEHQSNEAEPPKKKKRIQPTLLSAANP